MSEPQAADAFSRIIDHFTATCRSALSARLATLPSGFSSDEVALAQRVAEEALQHNARLKLNRVLLLELHAAARTGELTANDEAGRFSQFVDRCLDPEFALHLQRRYPPLLPRLQRALDQQRGAIEGLLERLAADREALTELLGHPAGRLTELALGQGDLHAGGHTVARVSFEGGTVMYKPRSLRIDAALDVFLTQVFGADRDRVRVPAVIDRGEYGWAAFAAHRYCSGEKELTRFYRGLGHWLAVLRLLGGTDIHLENLIAVGPVPVIIDVESLFELNHQPPPSAFGQAYDAAVMLIRNSVLRTGIVPFRAAVPGLEGLDLSAAGALPDQQPQVRAPIIVDEGTTQARLKIVDMDFDMAQNHPSPRPEVALYWDQISEGFLEGTAQLRKLDANGQLARLLAGFESCRAREIRRPTKAYVEIGRMLWHPASLHDEATAIERARDLFSRNAAAFAGAPALAEEIEGEITDLRYGDVPVFAAPLSRDRIDAVLADWRDMHADLEELTIRSSLVATDLNQRMRDRELERRGHLYAAKNPRSDRLDIRRRRLAANAVERLLRLAIKGDDGTATWITPEINRQGWIIQPVQPDLYFGLGGIAVVLAGYLHEMACGRAETVAGTEPALAGALRVLRRMNSAENPAIVVGGFSGEASCIWTWLTLYDLRGDPDMLASAVGHAEALERGGLDGDDRFDIVDGASGTIVPLLALAEATGDTRWHALAAQAGRRVEQAAIVDAKGARWPTAGTEQPSIGFAHGATGVAWALARLALSSAGSESDRLRWLSLSNAAFSFQESFYDETLGNWLDARDEDLAVNFHTWCHGSVGIGLAAADLYARTGDMRHLITLRRSVTSARGMWGSSHTLCHGDMSLRELFARAARVDPQGCASDPDEPVAQIVSSIEEHRGMVGGLTRAAFTPGLMTGLAGAVHGLNRMHPDCELASPLLLERRLVA